MYSEFGYLTLCGVVAVEALTLRALIERVAAYKRRYAASNEALDARASMLGNELMPFRARLLDSSEIFDKESIRGRATILLFVDPVSLISASRLVRTVLQAFMDKVDGCIYVVCSANDETCRRFRDINELHRLFGNRATIVVDDNGELRKKFSIDSTLRAIWIDDDGVVAKLGSLSEETAEDFEDTT